MSDLRYRFEICYQTQYMKAASDFLKKCDLGMEGICVKDVITFRYSREEKSVSYFKDLITQAMEMTGHTVLQIEGGKIE